MSTSSCENFYEPEQLLLKKDFKEIHLSETASILLPKYMNEQPFGIESTIQYQNDEKEVYTRITHVSKKDFITLYTKNNAYNPSISLLENYKIAQQNSLNTTVKNRKQESSRTAAINEMQAYIVEFKGKLVDLPIYYQITFIEGKDYLYNIHSWTIANKKNKYKGTFHQIAESLTEHYY